MVVLKNSYGSILLDRSDICRMIDCGIQEIHMMECPSCSSPIMYKEAIISQEQSCRIDEILNNFNRVITDTVSAAEKIYGVDVRLENLMIELGKIKESYTKPNLTIVK